MSLNPVTDEIAQTAARMVVEEGLEWGPAKHRAVRQLGLPNRTALPDNEQLEAAVCEYIELFCDDPKSAEITLINNNVQYEPSTVTGFHGQPVEALSIHAFCKPLNETVGVHLMVYDRDDVRGALKPDSAGRSPRGDALALRKLMAQLEQENGNA